MNYNIIDKIARFVFFLMLMLTVYNCFALGIK
jgi:hypothetical protein